MFQEQRPQIGSLYTKWPAVVGIVAVSLLADRVPGGFWGKLLFAIAIGLAVGTVMHFTDLHKWRVSPGWHSVDARVEGIQMVQGFYRISYSFSANGKIHGADIHIPAEAWDTAPSEDMVGQILQVRVNPTQMAENFILRRSMPGLRDGEREWIKN